MSTDAATALTAELASAAGVEPGAVRFDGVATLTSAYPVSDLAAASTGAAALAAAQLARDLGHDVADPVVHRELADAWFGGAGGFVRPVDPAGWPSPWDPIAGDYPAADGWIRLHTNAPLHRAAALRALGLGADAAADRDAVARVVAARGARELESAVVAEGGAAAELRTAAAWAAHPQGAAVAAEPLMATTRSGSDAVGTTWAPRPGRPLAGLRVLDLTRVLAGPTATQLLAGLGADVLRLDPPEWDEPGVLPLVTWGKRRARLDLRQRPGAHRLRDLLAGADVLVHGYRSDALDRLGLGAEERAAIRPGLVDVSLDAFGWTGPWATRRGFDSLVQLSSGIADTGMRAAGADRPVALPVQALDLATGYLLAAGVLAGLAERRRSGTGSRRRTSLARMAALLERSHGDVEAGRLARADVGEPPELARHRLTTAWGDVERADPPFSADGLELTWRLPAGPLGTDAAAWSIH